MKVYVERTIQGFRLCIGNTHHREYLAYRERGSCDWWDRSYAREANRVLLSLYGKKGRFEHR